MVALLSCGASLAVIAAAYRTANAADHRMARAHAYAAGLEAVLLAAAPAWGGDRSVAAVAQAAAAAMGEARWHLLFPPLHADESSDALGDDINSDDGSVEAQDDEGGSFFYYPLRADGSSTYNASWTQHTWWCLGSSTVLPQYWIPTLVPCGRNAELSAIARHVARCARDAHAVAAAADTDPDTSSAPEADQSAAALRTCGIEGTGNGLAAHAVHISSLGAWLYLDGDGDVRAEASLRMFKVGAVAVVFGIGACAVMSLCFFAFVCAQLASQSATTTTAPAYCSAGHAWTVTAVVVPFFGALLLAAAAGPTFEAVEAAPAANAARSMCLDICDLASIAARLDSAGLSLNGAAFSNTTAAAIGPAAQALASALGVFGLTGNDDEAANGDGALGPPMALSHFVTIQAARLGTGDALLLDVDTCVVIDASLDEQTAAPSASCVVRLGGAGEKDGGESMAGGYLMQVVINPDAACCGSSSFIATSVAFCAVAMGIIMVLGLLTIVRAGPNVLEAPERALSKQIIATVRTARGTASERTHKKGRDKNLDSDGEGSGDETRLNRRQREAVLEAATPLPYREFRGWTLLMQLCMLCIATITGTAYAYTGSARAAYAVVSLRTRVDALAAAGKALQVSATALQSELAATATTWLGSEIPSAIGDLWFAYLPTATALRHFEQASLALVDGMVVVPPNITLCCGNTTTSLSDENATDVGDSSAVASAILSESQMLDLLEALDAVSAASHLAFFTFNITEATRAGSLVRSIQAELTAMAMGRPADVFPSIAPTLAAFDGAVAVLLAALRAAATAVPSAAAAAASDPTTTQRLAVMYRLDEKSTQCHTHVTALMTAVAALRRAAPSTRPIGTGGMDAVMRATLLSIAVSVCACIGTAVVGTIDPERAAPPRSSLLKRALSLLVVSFGLWLPQGPVVVAASFRGGLRALVFAAACAFVVTGVSWRVATHALSASALFVSAEPVGAAVVDAKRAVAVVRPAHCFALWRLAAADTAGDTGDASGGAWGEAAATCSADTATFRRFFIGASAPFTPELSLVWRVAFGRMMSPGARPIPTMRNITDSIATALSLAADVALLENSSSITGNNNSSITEGGSNNSTASSFLFVDDESSPLAMCGSDSFTLTPDAAVATVFRRLMCAVYQHDGESDVDRWRLWCGSYYAEAINANNTTTTTTATASAFVNASTPQTLTGLRERQLAQRVRCLSPESQWASATAARTVEFVLPLSTSGIVHAAVADALSGVGRTVRRLLQVAAAESHPTGIAPAAARARETPNGTATAAATDDVFATACIGVAVLIVALGGAWWHWVDAGERALNASAPRPQVTWWWF